MAYNVINQKQIVASGDMSQASITSQVMPIINEDNVAFQIVWSGAPVGTFDVQVSVDHAQDSQGNVSNTGTWLSLTLSSPVAAAGSAGNAYVDINQISAPYIRVVYTKTSGTGTLNIWAAAKGV
jgi:hypothetical protein